MYRIDNMVDIKIIRTFILSANYYIKELVFS